MAREDTVAEEEKEGVIISEPILKRVFLFCVIETNRQKQETACAAVSCLASRLRFSKSTKILMSVKSIFPYRPIVRL